MKGSYTGGTPTEWVFSFLCFFRVLSSEGFFGGWSANPATNLLKKGNPTAGGHLQTQVGTILYMDGRWLTRSSSALLQVLFFILLVIHIHTPSSPGNLVGETV